MAPKVLPQVNPLTSIPAVKEYDLKQSEDAAAWPREASAASDV